jgi:nucleoid-associated protein YgaU
MAVPLLLDLGYKGGQLASVEHYRVLLDAMATSVANQKPPAVKIKSNKGVLPVPAGIRSDADWWIEDLAWGEETRRGSDGELGRKEVVVTLLERVDDPLFRAKQSGKASTKRSRNYTVRKGDTLHSIASKLFGDASLWKELADLNHLRSSGQLKVGMTLHLPANFNYEVFGPR